MPRLYKSQKERSISKAPVRNKEAVHDQYGHSEKGVAVCPVCKNVLFKKEWHHPDSKAFGKDFFAKKDFLARDQHAKLCPACRMTKEGLYEGEVTIKDISPINRDELVNIIKAFAEREIKRDPQTRIIRMRKDRNSFTVTTTENQFAVKIGKHLHKVFKKTDLNISHSKEPYEVSRVEVTFL
ncbi:hypothetical protein A3I18_01645 [Candidatus Campbellbacteria bacterium RIFCSPLOWO2_02_FULL_35_11]|uniref:Nmd3 N-terminal domain-containing protein n=2 Tax=Candidatus Campbelliibacteriota TaxID=1752727 RepID=A0A1F5ELW8_9BACT|nr:MAG: hypothetical protein A3E89_01690 [Candidatus Campbellbacteria bacterium RIFCSPHIGHO2_12_FULL_35_10]OGD69801.1 MAG: hypothetical protein A3I18_01645 [Candidatus Campbellbacteria bacterium RIFCSPLOWO2_02_FULL_35_11]